MASNPKTEHLTVFGGTGFLGHEIVKHLVAEGHFAHVASRHPENVDLYEDSDGGGRVIPVYADVRDEPSVANAIKGSVAVVNAVGLYVERGAATFQAVHEKGALTVAKQCAQLQIDRLVHVSGIGAVQIPRHTMSARVPRANSWS